MKLKKFAAAVMATMFTVTSFFMAPLSIGTVQAEEYWPSDIGISETEEAAIVMDVDSGAILYEQNMDVVHYPASITKVLTALVALENSELDEIVTFSSDAVYNCESGSSSIARDVGEQMTMEQCLYGMMLESANECAYAIGEHVAGGSISDFVDMMNAKAKELGCTSTHFNNSNGLPDEDHYTTAHDMALIARAAYQNEEFQTIVGTKSYTIPPTNIHSDPTPLNNHHAMLNYYKTSKYLYDYCVGGKTGYTDVANSTLVTYAKKDGMTLVCVIMNATSPNHYIDTTNLFNYCFDNFTVYNVSENADLFTDIAAKDTGLLSTDIDLLKVGENGSVILPTTVDFSAATATIEPVEDSDEGVIGRIVYTYAGRTVGSAELIYTESEAGDAYPFHNLDEEEGGSSLEYIKIDFKLILGCILLLAALVGAVILLKKQWDKFLMFKYRVLDPRKKTKSRYKKIEDKRGKRRRTRKRK